MDYFINNAHGFPSSMYKQIGRQPYLFQGFIFDAASLAPIWAKLKIQDFVITCLGKDLKKPIESVIMIIPSRPPPSFLNNCY